MASSPLGFVGFGLIDSVYLVGIADGTWSPGNVGEAGWPLAMLFMAAASLESLPRTTAVQLRGMRLLVAPALFAVMALGVLVYDHFDRVHGLALALSSGAIALVIARMALTFQDNMRQLSERAEQALSDALTGLGNRRKLYSDIERLSREGEASLLVLFDLNGFKDYNYRFGHPVGDALLVRVGDRLTAPVNGDGHAYRLGGDEFCTLTSHTQAEAESAAARLAVAFSEQGEGFSIGASYGWASIEGGTGPSDAMRLADRRMYADKHRGRATAARQSANVLAKALRERNRELSDHLGRVAHLAREVAVRLGISDKELEETVRAAELHDVGKVAIPDEILLKPGPLVPSERTFVEQHTIMSLEAALAELRRCSNTQFDGRVVDVFIEMVEQGDENIAAGAWRVSDSAAEDLAQILSISDPSVAHR